jgi:hypothetical protein
MNSQALALGQLAPWVGFPMGSDPVARQIAALNARVPFVFVLGLHQGEVRIAQKPEHYTSEEIAGTTRPTNRALLRAHAYRHFLAKVTARHGIQHSMHLVIAMRDLTGFEPALPVFTFQKPRGSRLVLLPDIDFLVHDFYRDAGYADPIPFAEKRATAVFAGATTGKPRITLDDVQQLALPRLRAAVHFRGSPRVDFRLVDLVECESADVAAAIRSLGIIGTRLPWSEAYAHRYLISMDGNGATCSRVALALRSNGVLLKYASDHLLHYFDALTPWRHYLPVGGDEEVTRVMDLCARHPTLAEDVAGQSQEFFRDHLQPEPLGCYTRDLLDAYAGMCGFASG